MKRKGTFTFGDIAVDFDRMELYRSGSSVPATSLEIRLLKFLVDNPGCVLSREELIRAVWPQRKRLSGRTVDNFILHLRRKIEEDPASPVYLRTMYGVGYKFVPPAFNVGLKSQVVNFGLLLMICHGADGL